MDSHNVGRGKISIPAALQAIEANTLIIGISTDLLFPPRNNATWPKIFQSQDMLKSIRIWAMMASLRRQKKWGT